MNRPWTAWPAKSPPPTRSTRTPPWPCWASRSAPRSRSPLPQKRPRPPDLRRPTDDKKGPAATPGLLFLGQGRSLEILRSGRALGGQTPRRDAGGNVGSAARQLGAAVEAEGLFFIGAVQAHI